MYLQYDPKEKTLTGLLLECDRSTISGRTYPFAEVVKAVDVYKSKIEAGTAIGELGFNYTTNNPNPNNAAVQTLEVHFKDKMLYGTLKVLNTPSGQLLTSMLNAKQKFRAGMASIGTVTHSTVTNMNIEMVNVVNK